MTRQVANVVSVSLPTPPSVNAAFASRRGTHLLMKTAVYRFWERQVREEHGGGALLPTLPVGAYGLWLDLAPEMRGDADNRIKPASDILKLPSASGEPGLGVVTDDKLMRGIHVAFLPGLARNRCYVTVVEMNHWAAYVCMRMEI